MSDKGITVLYVDDEELNLFLFEKGFENLYNLQGGYMAYVNS